MERGARLEPWGGSARHEPAAVAPKAAQERPHAIAMGQGRAAPVVTIT